MTHPQHHSGTRVAALDLPRLSPRVLLPALLGLIAALAFSGCDAESNDAQGAATPAQSGRSVRVETLVLSPSTFEDVVQITGAVEAVDDATLSAQAAGTIQALMPLGSNVSAGGAVAQLDPTLTRSAVEQAEAQVASSQAQFDLAEDNMNRNESLYRDSVISAIEWQNVRAQYNQARAGLSQAQAGLSQAREQLRRSTITSPFSGTIEAHLAEIGEQVMPGSAVARVINTSRVKVVAGVPERYAADIRVGTPVTIDFRAYTGQNTRGEVSFVGRAIDRDSRTFPIEILMPNPTGTIKPEMVAQVYVTREQMEGAIVVPRSAIVRDEDGNSVFLVEQEGDRAVAVKTPVVLGAGYGGNVVVSNLQAGDEVVVLGQATLTDRDAVQVMDQYASPTQAATSLSVDSSTVDD